MTSLKNFLFVILSTDKYIDDRVESIKQTWSKNLNKVFLVDKKINENDLLGYGLPQIYDSIQLKYINFFKTYNFNLFEYYFFSDDDTFVNLKNVSKFQLPNSDICFCIGRKLLLNQDATDMFGRNTGYPMYKISGDNTKLPLYHPSGGSGFILSRATCIKIQTYLNSLNDSEIPKSGHSDVTVGFWVRNIDCEFINENNFWYEKPEILIHDEYSSYKPENDDNFLTYHYVNSNLMLEYHKKYNNE